MVFQDIVLAIRSFAWGEDPDNEHHIDFNVDPFLWTLFFCTSLGLVIMAGLMSGLTLGLMSLDSMELEVRLWLRSSIFCFCGFLLSDY